MQAHYWQEALDFLSQDSRLAEVIRQYPDLVLTSRGNAFQTLIRSVVGQQISVAAADSVWGKIIHRFGNDASYECMQKTTIAELKSCGLSTQKATYLQNIADFFATNGVDENYWRQYEYRTIYQQLIGIKGVGEWTIQMFAIFYLLEPDILPLKDLGLIRGIEKLYGREKNSMDKEEIAAITNLWRPYRTVATWYIWRLLDDEAIVY